MLWNYKLTTSTIWLSFDEGQVEADTLEEATAEATRILKYNLDKVNDILNSCDPTIGISVDMDFSQLEVELVNESTGRTLVDDFYNKASAKLMSIYFPSVKYHRDNETSQRMTYELELFSNGVTNWNTMTSKIAKLVQTPYVEEIKNHLQEFLKK